MLNAAFDIVSDAVMPAMEAECIFVTEEILDAFPLAGKPAHLINHSKILDAIIDIFPSKQREAVCEILVQHGRLQRTWSKTSSELFKLIGVTRSMCDLLGALNSVGASPPLGPNVGQLLTSVPALRRPRQDALACSRDRPAPQARRARRLRRVEGHHVALSANGRQEHQGRPAPRHQPRPASQRHHLRVARRARQDARYCRRRWEVRLSAHVWMGRPPAIASPTHTCPAHRFDDVVSRLAAPEVRFSGRCPHVVGFSLAVAKLSVAAADANATSGKHAMTRKEEHLRSYGPWAIRRCDVYVCSFSPGLIDLRLDIVKDLWQAGLKADLVRLLCLFARSLAVLPRSRRSALLQMYDDDFLTLTPEQLVSACRREGILWLVIVKPSAAGRSAADESDMSLKVKSVLRGAEEEGKLVLYRGRVYRERKVRRSADLPLPATVPRVELATWLIKEMREQTIVDEAVGGGSNDTVADSSTALVDPPKPNREYIPLLADDDVRQKGRHNKRTMIAHRGELFSFRVPLLGHSRSPPRSRLRSQPKRTSRRRPRRHPRLLSVRSS